MALVAPLFEQTGEVLSSPNWLLMSPARRPLPLDLRHPQSRSASSSETEEAEQSCSSGEHKKRGIIKKIIIIITRLACLQRNNTFPVFSAHKCCVKLQRSDNYLQILWPWEGNKSSFGDYIRNRMFSRTKIK